MFPYVEALRRQRGPDACSQLAIQASEEDTLAVVAAFFQSFLSRNAGEPRDVTTRAAKRVGEREGRKVRVPKEPAAATSGGSAAPEAKPAEPTA